MVKEMRKSEVNDSDNYVAVAMSEGRVGHKN